MNRYIAAKYQNIVTLHFKCVRIYLIKKLLLKEIYNCYDKK